jgi:hypothetical protein
VGRYESGGVVYYSVWASAPGYLLRVHTLCDFLVDEGGRDVVCLPEPDTSSEVVSILLGGTISALLWALRGAAVLHGSAVVGPRGTPIAFLGPTNSGKSTVAALCCAAGAGLVSDDVVALVPDQAGPSPVVACGRASELRLRPGAEQLTQLWPAGVPRRVTGDGRVAIRPRPARGERHPLAIVALLDPDPGTERVELSPLAPNEALFALLGYGRLPGLTDRRLHRPLFELCSAVATDLPVVVARIPWKKPFTLEHGEQILSALETAAQC